MSSDIETIRQWTRVILTITAICVSVFPLLYLFSPWYKSQLGRAMMLQSLSIAFAVDFSAVYQYWAFTENLKVLVTIRLFMFVFVGAASIYLTTMLIHLNFKTHKERRTMSNNVPGEVKPSFFSNETYDKLKFLALVVLPALGTLYFALAGLWNLPQANEVVGTITAIDAFLGIILGISAKKYNDAEETYDGVLEINASDSSLIHTLELTTAPEDLGKKSAVVFRVNQLNTGPMDDSEHP